MFKAKRRVDFEDILSTLQENRARRVGRGTVSGWRHVEWRLVASESGRLLFVMLVNVET
jgi:hypothetical protein